MIEDSPSFQVRGKDLKARFFQVFDSGLYQKLLASDPSITLKHLNSSDLLQPTIRNIRQSIRFACADYVVPALSIVVAHSHWPLDKVIIYRYLDGRYIIGPFEISDEKLYTPVSFLISGQCIYPYEWTDETITIGHEEWSEAIRAILNMCQNFPENSGLTVNIDFRYKESLFDISTGSVENPVEDPVNVYCGFSEIFSLRDWNSMQLNTHVEGVSWHPWSDEFYKLTDEEEEILSRINEELSKIGSEEERDVYLSNLIKAS